LVSLLWNGYIAAVYSAQSSVPELRIYSALKAILKSKQHRTKIQGHEVDIFMREINIDIEYEGVRLHKNNSSQE
jgi:hypothetical protein